mmetsp:Transcript_20144/g.24192  ORF Transcript_20144/g.24192 Transcript_20144/m.24192 type:complete len:187 (-) Transcript_20144:1043-1603(-)
MRFSSKACLSLCLSCSFLLATIRSCQRTSTIRGGSNNSLKRKLEDDPGLQDEIAILKNNGEWDLIDDALIDDDQYDDFLVEEVSEDDDYRYGDDGLVAYADDTTEFEDDEMHWEQEQYEASMGAGGEESEEDESEVEESSEGEQQTPEEYQNDDSEEALYFDDMFDDTAYDDTLAMDDEYEVAEGS